MSKTNKNSERLKNSKRREQNREERHEIKQLIKEGKHEDLDTKEPIRANKEKF